MSVTLDARITTPLASRYLQQLCKHWSHKFAITFTPETGHVPFRDGAWCDMTADAEALSLRITAPDQEGATRLSGVVFEHLQRFAFKDPLPEPEWRPAT